MSRVDILYEFVHVFLTVCLSVCVSVLSAANAHSPPQRACQPAMHPAVLTHLLRNRSRAEAFAALYKDSLTHTCANKPTFQRDASSAYPGRFTPQRASPELLTYQATGRRDKVDAVAQEPFSLSGLTVTMMVACVPMCVCSCLYTHACVRIYTRGSLSSIMWSYFCACFVCVCTCVCVCVCVCVVCASVYICVQEPSLSCTV